MIILASTKHIYMGNKMLLYANFIAWGIEHNKKIINPSFGLYAEYFESTTNDLHCRFPVQKSFFKGNLFARKMYYKLVYYFAQFIKKFHLGNNFIDVLDIGWDDECLLEGKFFMELIASRKILFLQGWLYGTELRAKHAQQIREYFTPHKVYRENVKNLIQKSKKNIDILVGVHIRQGDYKTFRDGIFYYETEQYVKLMHDLLEMFINEKVGFLICSNVPQEKDNFDGLVIGWGAGHPIEDMYALAECDYIIGPPSTYSAWASFYGNTPCYFIEHINEPAKIENFIVK